MGHEGHHHEEKQPLGFFASPLNEHIAHPTPSTHSSDVEAYKPVDTSYNAHDTSYSTTHVPFGNTDCSLHENPAFHRHAEATTSELFYDLFFVANLTTFTSMLEINDNKTLTAYMGFFSLLWLTWYQVSLYDVRFSTDSVFERVAKAIHFGVMVGFAVIGPQWKPGQEILDYKIYKAFGLILMVSRITLFMQYAVTLLYVKKYKKTIVPLCIILGSTLLAAILYGTLTPVFPKETFDAEGPVLQKSNVYIAWYVIALCETLTTVAVSCRFLVISFKGTHMVQRMSLLTLIILGEGIIVVCKSISKIVKNEFLWTAAVVGQIIAAVLIIYFLYMLYFDRMQEEHFGSIWQQIWSFAHFPLHVVLVLVLQGVSLLIIWAQIVQAVFGMYTNFATILEAVDQYPNGTIFAEYLNETAYDWVFCCVPKGVDATKELKTVDNAVISIANAFDYMSENSDNATVADEYMKSVSDLVAATTKTLFDSFSVTVPKKKMAYGADKQPDFMQVFYDYLGVFQLVFVYVFVAVSEPFIPRDEYMLIITGRLLAHHSVRSGLYLAACFPASHRYVHSPRSQLYIRCWLVSRRDVEIQRGAEGELFGFGVDDTYDLLGVLCLRGDQPHQCKGYQEALSHGRDAR
jgi:low temperature requirement protein LtrA